MTKDFKINKSQFLLPALMGKKSRPIIKDRMQHGSTIKGKAVPAGFKEKLTFVLDAEG